MTTNLSQPDRALIERVRKLLDKAARTENEHESEAFARKAAELVALHRLDPDQIAARELPEDLTLIDVAVGRGAYVRARLDLLSLIADAHDVRMVFRSTPTGSVASLAGSRSDLGVVEVMYASLHSQAASQMAELRGPTGAATQRERRAFLFGFADRIGEILAESREHAQAAVAARTDSESVALVVREQRERVAEFATQTWGRVRSASRPKAVAAGGYARGVAAAEKADVGSIRLGDRSRLDSGTP
jgi:hypothetical protein